MISIPQAVYIHIPFCNRICPYCDFTKYVLQGQPVRDYLSALKKEMQATVAASPSRPIRSIFVGGGTPTTLSPEELKYFFHSIEQCFPHHEDEFEFTMEANPECITEEKLQVMKAAGVNRLSFGVQTFDPYLLRKLGRLHTREEVFAAIHLAKQVGFNNISIDLMFGLPEQSLEIWQETLALAFSLDIKHFSAYSLKVEEGTHFYHLYQKEKLSLPSEDEESAMYELLLAEMSKHGFFQYEISNFAKPGYESMHNLTYWRNQEYYGFGVGAHGYVQGVRQANVDSLTEYLRFIQECGFAVAEKHAVSQRESMEDMFIMGLRTREGVSKHDFYKRYGVEMESIYAQKLAQLLQLGLLESDGERLFLSKRGIFLGNEVFAFFLQD